MPNTDFTVVGAEDLDRLAKRLKATGDKGLRKELLRGIRNAAKPLKVAARRGALTRLPKHGGLNTLIAGSKIGVRTRTSGNNVGVTLTGTSAGHDLKAIDRGRLRHPTFGKGGWVTQEIEPGYWSEALKEQTPTVRREVVKVIEDVARKVT